MFECTLPGSKSISNRFLTLAGMSQWPVKIQNLLIADDTIAGLECLKCLGFTVEIIAKKNLFSKKIYYQNTVLITPPNFEKLNKENFYDKILQLNLNSAGTLARFFPAVILNWNNTFPNSKPIKVCIQASEQLQKRPMTKLLTALQDLGAKIENTEYPFLLASSILSGNIEIDTTQSSQFLSGLLFAEYGAKESIKITQTNLLPQRGYVEMTKSTIQMFKEQKKNLPKTIAKTKLFEGIEVTVEPDASSASYFLAAAFLHNFNLTVNDLGTNSLQPDIEFCEFLKKLGACIDVLENQIVLHKRSETTISGGFSYSFLPMSDQALTAAVLALFANAPITITGIAHIRHHESDRIAGLIKNFNAFNWKITEKNSEITIYPLAQKSFQISTGTWFTYNDHRFAMSGQILNSLNPKIKIENKQCVKKTYPQFFDDCTQFNISI